MTAEPMHTASRFVPYPIPKGYLEHRDPSHPAPRHLGHDLYLALAESFEATAEHGIAEIHIPEDLAERGTPDQLIAEAQRNLADDLRAGAVGIARFTGPNGVPFMLFGGDWRAASCLMLPDLHAFVARHLGEGPFCVSVPHRGAMVVFPDGGPEQRSAMQAMIAAKEAGEPKPLTPHLFSLGPEGIAPIPP